MVIWDFLMRGILGLFVMMALAYLLVFVDWASSKIRKEIPTGIFVAGTWFSIFVASWMMCYGAGSFVIDLFFR